MAGTRIICLGILMASCLAIFFYRGDMLISISRDSLGVQSQTHLSLRALKKHHASMMHAVRQRHADTLPNIRHHAAGGKLELPEGEALMSSSVQERADNRYSTRMPHGAYLAMCLVVKDQGDDLREWVDYHRSIGVDKFYIFDDNSTVPALDEIEDLVEAGVVEYEAVESFESPSGKVQLWVYDTCIQRYRGMHQWMAFIDVDEFLIITGSNVTMLPDLLKDYADYGALAVNWQMFGSSGHLTRPLGGTLESYVDCFEVDHLENKHIKTIANLDFVERADRDPHHFLYMDGKYAVNTAYQIVEGARADNVVTDRLLLHHYVTKSLEQYLGKIARGSAMGNRKSIEFYDFVQSQATEKCMAALHLGR